MGIVGKTATSNVTYEVANGRKIRVTRDPTFGTILARDDVGPADPAPSAEELAGLAQKVGEGDWTKYASGAMQALVRFNGNVYRVVKDKNGKIMPTVKMTEEGVGGYRGNIVDAGGSQGAADALTPEGLYGEYQKNYEEAKAANEARYAELQQGYAGLEAEMMGLTEGQGQSARNRIAEGQESLVGQGMQDLVTSGLYGTSLQQGVRTGAARVAGEQNLALDESLAQQKLGILGNVRGNALGMVERREDTYPDMNMLLQLAQMYGNYGNTSGGTAATPGLGARAIGGGATFVNTPGVQSLYSTGTSQYSSGSQTPATGRTTPASQVLYGGQGSSLVDTPQALAWQGF